MTTWDDKTKKLTALQCGHVGRGYEIMNDHPINYYIIFSEKSQ